MKRILNHQSSLSFRVVIVGSGAASLNAAVQLKRLGIDDIAVITEGERLGTSANTGSDKQTYYRLNPGGPEGDSITQMAKDLFSGGSMHGDTALVEAALSAQCFSHLCSLGVEFPFDEYGIYPGYRTDHDTAGRAASAGPHTSIMMHAGLLAEAKRLGTKILGGMEVIRILTQGGKGKKVCGLIALDRKGGLQEIAADYIVWGTGGPAALYADSVYPKQQTGSLGVALMAGAKACNLTESQFGIASVEPRWNLSGSYQQVLPDYFSCAPDGSDKKNFLAGHFSNPGDMIKAIFLKGYEWPFDSRKVPGSSVIDLLVHRERTVLGRKVYMDFTRNPFYPGLKFSIKRLPDVVQDYLKRSGATGSTPAERLRQMNPSAYELYLGRGRNLSMEPIEIAVCNQHLNGGLAVDKWWETSIENLFAVGEAAGTHGIYRPGGSALNSGQVGSLRAAQRIANRISTERANGGASKIEYEQLRKTLAMIETALANDMKISPAGERRIIQQRVSATLGIIRSGGMTEKAAAENALQLERHLSSGVKGMKDLRAWLKNIDLLIAERAMLDASMVLLGKVGGGRGSFMVSDKCDLQFEASSRRPRQKTIHGDRLTSKVMETRIDGKGRPHSQFIPVRPLPSPDNWFEAVWARFRKGEVFRK
jgi:succinate dehydrogenase/fumarate reductase flavoprotein subunit